MSKNATIISFPQIPKMGKLIKRVKNSVVRSREYHLTGDDVEQLLSAAKNKGLLYVNRLKNGTASTHQFRGPEIRALRRLKHDYQETPYVFVTERKGPMTTSNVRKMIPRAGQESAISFPVHPHMLRHACGFKLANGGQDTRAVQQYLGHKNIQHTGRYTELTASRFNGFWHD